MNYQWRNYLLDAKQYRLLRDGKQVEVEPQVFDLLVYLIDVGIEQPRNFIQSTEFCLQFEFHVRF